MYKIQFLFVILFMSPVDLLAQKSVNRQFFSALSRAESIRPSSVKPGLTDPPARIRLPNQVQTNRPLVFTDHLLAHQVEPGRKPAYDASIGGQKASLPYPTLSQTQFR